MNVCSDVLLVRCRGRMVFGDEPLRIASRAAKLAPAARHFIVDLSGVESFATGDLGPLIIYYMGACSAGCQIALTGVPDHIMAILNSTGTSSLFEIHDTPYAAGLRRPDDEPHFASAR